MRILNTSMFHRISCIIFLLPLFAQNLLSQNTDDKFPWQKHWFIGISGGPAQTEISNDWIPVVSGTANTGKMSYTLSLDAGYFFSKYFGVISGIGYSTYITGFSLDTYYNTMDTVDSEGENYERRTEGSGIHETVKLQLIEIPVILNFQCPLGKSFGFYLQGGINLAFTVGKEYTSSGTFSYSGYYPAYNVVLKDIPYEGFKSNVKNDITGDLVVKTFNPELNTSAGFYFHNKKNLQVSAGIFYRSLFSNISDYSPPASFQLSTHEDQLRSLMEGSEKTTARSMGISISVRYYLR